MLINARRVALHCVEFIADVAKGAPAAAALWEDQDEVRAALLGFFSLPCFCCGSCTPSECSYPESYV